MTPILQVKDLVFGYNPRLPVLQGITFSVPAGDFAAVIGPNGSGKTTLVKHFNGLLRPTSGQVLLRGQDLSRISIGEIARTVGYVFQNPDHQIFSATTRQEIAFGLRNLGLGEAQVRERTERALADFRLNLWADRQPAVLSYGLRRKISLAAVLTMTPDVLILDEPTTGLDRRSIQELLAWLQAYHRQGHTILLITHDVRLIADHLPRCLALNNGQLVAYDETRRVLTHPDMLGQFSATLPQVTRLAQRLAPAGFKPDTLTVAEFCSQFQNLSHEKAGL